MFQTLAPKGDQKRRKIRIFRDPENVRRARNMLLSGYSLSEVSRVFGVDHTSIIALKRRLEAEGVVFPEHYTKLAMRGPEFDIPIPPIRTTQKEQRRLMDLEKINRGKKSYEEYLKEYQAQTCEAMGQIMQKAKDTISELHDKRKREGYCEITDWEYDVVTD